MNWPVELLPLFERAMTCEFATLTRQGVPITHPLIPYPAEDGLTLDVSTSLASPAKAERARHNPRVALLYSDKIGFDVSPPPLALVYGLASVSDADVQSNTDRYVKLSLAKSPAAFRGIPSRLLQRFDWYFARIWIRVTPLRILWWPTRNTDEMPRVWQAPADIQPRPSDPPPASRNPVATKGYTKEWRKVASHAISRLGKPVLTTVDAGGFPVPMRALHVLQHSDGFLLQMPSGAPSITAGPACLTFHTHAQVFSGQENKSFLGQVVMSDGREIRFEVERLLPDWSFPGSRLSAALAFVASGYHLAPRLETECLRRRQPVPIVRIVR